MIVDGTTQVVSITAFGAAHLAGHYLGVDWLRRVAKGVPVVLLIGVVLGSSAPATEPYRLLIAAALAASLAGDLFLLSPAGFRPGLASFLVAHLLYAAAFCSGPWTAPGLAWTVLVAAAAGTMFAWLWPHLGRERAPVAVYVLAIAAMAWAAAGRASAGVPGGTLALAGAFTFMLSDATLAADRFVRRFAAAQALVMATYYAAQVMLAWSAVG